MITTDPNILSRLERSSSLTDKYRPSQNFFTTELFHTKPPTYRITTIP
jgi:hypothetical protein